MEEREASTASVTDFYDSDRKPETPSADRRHGLASVKRKAEELGSIQDKKPKLDQLFASPLLAHLEDCAGLPPQIWQHIFLFCSVTTLGRLLQVNRSFRSYLTDVHVLPSSKPDKGFVPLIKSESIWSSARNAHPTKPPGPLPGFLEVDMWRLILGKPCQFCKKQSHSTPSDKVWQKGPGEDGVRIIWPFAVRSCGPCLFRRSEKESTLLFSAASALRPALPFAFVTSTGDYIPAYTLQGANVPPSVEITKYYYKGDVESISEELEQAQGRGPAAAEEWFKGLGNRGKKRMRTAETWERWEAKYQWWLNRRSIPSAAPASPAYHGATGSPLRHNPSPLKQSILPPSTTPQSFHPRPATVQPTHYIPHPPPSTPFQPSHAERNIHDANEAKSARKADIEHRCQQLNPPISANILRHMESFKAAIQISRPMTDEDWSVLQPRLLAQFPAAEQAERDHISRITSIQSRVADRRQQDASLKEVKEALDREWDESQKPIRDRLNEIADDFINTVWDNGKGVTNETSPKFAVDVLMHVRKVFYAETARQNYSPAEEQRGAAMPPRSRLVLENMKWVYDNKIKPLTEQFRKELFLCHGSGCEGNIRFYGFEGVIQHYGAKHTNAFSVGNVVVSWREAEWPEETPFHPDPNTAKHHSISILGHGHSSYNSHYGGYTARPGTSTPHVQAHIPFPSPGPYHQQYSVPYNGPFAPPPTNISGYDYNPTYGPPPVDMYQSGPSSYGQPSRNPGCTESPAIASSTIRSNGTMGLQVFSGQGDSVAQTVLNSDTMDIKYRTDMFEQQVSSVIRIAQDTWKQTSGIKDLPSNVRVYVLMQRIVSRFQLEFNHEPTLDHMIEAFSNQDVSRGLKTASGLCCKACREDPSQQPSGPFVSLSEDRRTYTLLNLLFHFRSQHGIHASVSPGGSYTTVRPPLNPDWKEDMIELPSARVIAGLIHAPGMDDEKLHIVATVFPSCFPTPLPRIASRTSNDAASPAQSQLKDPKEASFGLGTAGIPVEKTKPSSVASPFPCSPRISGAGEEEYDPQRPALPPQSNQSARITARRSSYRRSHSPEHHQRQLVTEPRYYISRDPPDHDIVRSSSREYVDIGNGGRIIRNPAPYESIRDRRPLYHDRDEYYQHAHPGVIYNSQSRDVYSTDEYDIHGGGNHPRETTVRRTDDLVTRDPDFHEPGPSRVRLAADEFLDRFDPREVSTTKPMNEPGGQPGANPTSNGSDLDDGSRYTPPPAIDPLPAHETDSGRTLAPRQPAFSNVSHVSRYSEYRPTGHEVPRPDSGDPSGRAGSLRRRDRPQHDYIPSRYYRYMTVARDEPPYSRSISRTQSRRYSRYEEQRRRLDQEETPQPNVDMEYDRGYSPEQSMDRGRPERPLYRQIGPGPHGYLPMDNPHASYSPVRYRFTTGPEMDPHPEIVDQYGRPVHEYELVPVQRDIRAPRGPPGPYAPTRYVPRQDSDQIEYVSVSYERGARQAPLDIEPRYRDQRPYVFYEDGERSTRIHTFEPEGETRDCEARAESKGHIPASGG